MEIIPIFVDNYEGLHSIKYGNEADNEFERLFELWNDYEYLFDFCKANEGNIFNDFFQINQLEDFIDMVRAEAWELENIFLGFYENSSFTNGALQRIFMPYHNQEYKVTTLQLSKGKISYELIRKPLLRLYALRVDNNTFILTGGCIKTTKTVQE